MEIESVFIWSIFLFITIFLSVRLAINPLLKKQEEITPQNDDAGLVKLRDMKIFSNSELDEVMKLYKNMGKREEDYKQYEKYLKVLDELKEMDYFSLEQYSIKINLLKKHFNIK